MFIETYLHGFVSILVPEIKHF